MSKIVVDSDNHYPAWMVIHDGSRFISCAPQSCCLPSTAEDRAKRR